MTQRDLNTGLLTPGPGYDWCCQRCEYEWRSRKPNAPKPTACAGCRSAYWDKPPREKKPHVESNKKSKGKKKGRKKKLSMNPRAKWANAVTPKPEPKPLYTMSVEELLETPLMTGGSVESVLEPPPHLRTTIPTQPSNYLKRDRDEEPQPENLIRRRKQERAERQDELDAATKDEMDGDAIV